MMGEYFKDEMKEMQKVMKITVGKMGNKDSNSFLTAWNVVLCNFHEKKRGKF